MWREVWLRDGRLTPFKTVAGRLNVALKAHAISFPERDVMLALANEHTMATLVDNTDAVVAVHEGLALYIELPTSVELLISHTDPGLQGDRSTGGTKPATLETGAEIQVPLFVTTGEKVKVDTRDGRYLGRISG